MYAACHSDGIAKRDCYPDVPYSRAVLTCSNNFGLAGAGETSAPAEAGEHTRIILEDDFRKGPRSLTIFYV